MSLGADVLKVNETSSPEGTTVGGGDPRRVADATCLQCGCLCDDIQLTILPNENRILSAERACPLGTAWFLEQRSEEHPATLLDGQPASPEDAIRRAVEILTAARQPLVYGLGATTTAAQRLAVAIADQIGGTIDIAATAGQRAVTQAFQTVGQVTATLGEIRNRADCVVYWGTDPVESHPRHAERYSLTPASEFLPRGRADRFAVLVHVNATSTAAQVDRCLRIRPGSDLELAWGLRALARGLEPDGAVEATTGVTVAALRELMEQLRRARFGAILFGSGVTNGRSPRLTVEAILELARDMQRHTRFVALALGGPGNLAGAGQVLTWTTGYPDSVNFARGYPRYGPGEFSAGDLLLRGEPDAALIVAADPRKDLPAAAGEHLQRIPTVVLAPPAQAALLNGTVAFATATYGIQTAGTVYRSDGVALPLRPALASAYPSDHEILAEIERGIRVAVAGPSASGSRPASVGVPGMSSGRASAGQSSRKKKGTANNSRSPVEAPPGFEPGK